MIERKNLIARILLFAGLIAGAFLSLAPFYWMFIAATHSTGEIFALPPNLLPGKHLMSNLANLQAEVGLARVVFNSTILAVVYTIVTVFLSAMAGYAFAKFEFRGRDVIFFGVLITIMVPYQATLIPLFSTMAKLGWINTYKAVLIPNLANAFGIFLMRQNMQAVPTEMIEAGRIDGCSEFGIFMRIVLPSMRPALAALAIYMFMFQWNNFMWPLVVLNDPKMYTIPVALSSLIGLSRIDYGQLMLGASVSTLPIMAVFLILQRQFISGILSGSVKG